jgi:uncharacterized membrane protein
MLTKHAAGSASNLRRISMFGIPIHKLIIHFPIALTIIALIYDSWALYAKKPELHRTAYGLTLWAAVGALAAAGTGLQLAEMVRLDKGAVTGHAGFAIASTIVLAGLAGLRYSAQAQERKQYQIWWLVVEVMAGVLIVATAVTGHRL